MRFHQKFVGECNDFSHTHCFMVPLNFNPAFADMIPKVLGTVDETSMYFQPFQPITEMLFPKVTKGFPGVLQMLQMAFPQKMVMSFSQSLRLP